MKEKILGDEDLSLADLLKTARTGEVAREQAKAIESPDKLITQFKSELISVARKHPSSTKHKKAAEAPRRSVFHVDTIFHMTQKRVALLKQKHVICVKRQDTLQNCASRKATLSKRESRMQ